MRSLSSSSPSPPFFAFLLFIFFVSVVVVAVDTHSGFFLLVAAAFFRVAVLVLRVTLDGAAFFLHHFLFLHSILVFSLFVFLLRSGFEYFVDFILNLFAVLILAFAVAPEHVSVNGFGLFRLLFLRIIIVFIIRVDDAFFGFILLL